VPVSSYGVAASHREKLKLDNSRAPAMREIYPQLAELRLEFEFQDTTARPPSALAFSYFPAARGFFRYACPCHTCNGEFDLSAQVAELADVNNHPPRTKRVNITCTGQRALEADVRGACPIIARVRLSATPHRE
jgi:hypothetical protein